MGEENEDSSIYDISIDDLKKNLNKTNEDLLISLRERFTQNLLTSMIFFIFNEICRKESSDLYEKDSIANKFFSYWFENMRKQSKKEMLEVNKKLKDEKMNYLSAISNFSLPTTEDYQAIYNKALLDAKEMFEKNTKIN
jgi:hypothetical protein